MSFTPKCENTIYTCTVLLALPRRPRFSGNQDLWTMEGGWVGGCYREAFHSLRETPQVLGQTTENTTPSAAKRSTANKRTHCRQTLYTTHTCLKIKHILRPYAKKTSNLYTEACI